MNEAAKYGFTMNIGPEAEFFLFSRDENGNILLKEGNLLSSAVYNRIQKMDVQGLYVNDEISAGIEVEDLIRYNLKSDALKALLGKNVQKKKPPQRFLLKSPIQKIKC